MSQRRESLEEAKLQRSNVRIVDRISPLYVIHDALYLYNNEHALRSWYIERNWDIPFRVEQHSVICGLIHSRRYRDFTPMGVMFGLRHFAWLARIAPQVTRRVTSNHVDVFAKIKIISNYVDRCSLHQILRTGIKVHCNCHTTNNVWGAS